MINAPSELTATAISYSEIRLTWQDNSNNEDGFIVERKDWSDETWRELILRTVLDMTSYSDTEILSFTRYYYRVRAFNTIGDYSSYSNEVSITTGDNIVWSSFTAGESHTMGLTTNSTIWVWGNNQLGQLGLGDNSPLTVTVPTLLNDESNWSIINAGYYHSLALKTNGTLWAWGSNESGQLGSGDWNNYTAPLLIGTDYDWSLVIGGSNHTLGLKTNPAGGGAGGTIWSWGFNGGGQLGLGDSGNGTDRNTPTQIGIDSDWVNVQVGNTFSFGIKNNGTLWSWGNNNAGQLGLGYAGDPLDPDNPLNYVTTPSMVGTGSDWLMVEGEEYTRTYGLKTGGTLWEWGDGVSSPVRIGSGTDWRSISSGLYHRLALKTNGEIWSWGYNAFGQLGLGDYENRDPPSQIEMKDWVLITAGGYHSLGLSTNGSLWVWGANYDGQLGLSDTINRNVPYPVGSPVPPSSLIVNLISSSQIDLSWADNANNEECFKIERKTNRNGTYAEIDIVGVNVISYSDINPTGFAPRTTYYYRVRAYNLFANSFYSNESYTAISGNWFDVSTGYNHTLGLKSDATAWAWGRNDSGQLGLGGTVDRITPTQVGTQSDWLNLIGGSVHTLGLKTDNTAWSWGYNNNGQLGLGHTNLRKTPVQIGTQSDWYSLVAGQNHSLGLKTDNTAWAWGFNQYSQLGLGDMGINRNTPTQIGTQSDWYSLAAGDHHSLGLKTDNTIWSWGYNRYGQLGLGDMGINRTTPTQIGTQSDWYSLIASNHHSIGLKTDSTAWAWGLNNNGQLGLGDTETRETPVQISTKSDWLSLTTGSAHTLGLKIDGTIWSWGDNSSGQLGLGDVEKRETPTQIGTQSDWVTIATGNAYTLGLKINGTVWSWGQNSLGQLGLGDTIDKNVPTLVGE
jgi:alpha-tubulin suppressor-like RCC1 family protein